MVAYVRSFSGLAANKPPQDNQIMQEDTFTYRVLCINAPMPMDTNIFQPVWQNLPYSAGSQVFYNIDFWRATANTLASDIPGQSSKWVQVPNYALELLNAQRELRLLFSWPQEPNGNVGGFRQTFRSTVAGQLIVTNYFNYFPPVHCRRPLFLRVPVLYQRAMIQKLPIAGCRLPIEVGVAGSYPGIENRKSKIENAFSMVELLVAMTLMTLIVLALMVVFNSTQRAFRASVTQTDILEGGRAAVDIMTTDLRGMVPSSGISNYVYNAGNNTYGLGAVNFFAVTNNCQFVPALSIVPPQSTLPALPYLSFNLPYQPLPQSLPGTSVQRNNQLEYFFMLGRENTKWTGTGYVVNSGSSSPLFPLYRFYAEVNISANPYILVTNFLSKIYYSQWTNMSHVMDGVVHLTVDAYDANGYRMTNTYQFQGNLELTNRNIVFVPPLSPDSQVGFAFYTNAVPAAVELELGILEDRTLQRAQSLGIQGTSPNNNPPQWSYLQNQSGHVQLFRQRVNIPNVDPSAYQ